MARKVTQRRNEQGFSLPKTGRDRVELFSPVEVHVLEGVNDVEPGNPGHDNTTEDQRRQGELTADRQVASHWCGGLDETQVEVGCRG